MADPNWLLSTTAGSSAALVAIVGGLLVSRVVAQRSSRESLRRRSEELEAQIGALTTQLEEAGEELLRRDAVDFIHEAADDLVASKGRIKLERLMRRHDPRDRDADELRPFVEEAGGAVAEAFEREDPGVMLETGTDRYARLYARLCEALGVEPDEDGGRPQEAPFTLKQEEAYRQLLRDQQSLGGELRTRRLERAQVDAALGGLADPRGIWPGLGVLLYFSIAGCLVPLVVMAFAPERLGTGAGLGIVGLFASGLLALAVYLGFEVWRLSRP
jgi:PAS domain-containing protein